MRTACKCRTYPDQEQAHVLNRTSGCVRVAWNQTLAWRRQRYHAEKTGTTYAQANGCLTPLKATDELAWLNEVSSVPLQQAIRHQQAAYTAFFARRARCRFTWSWPGIDPATLDPATVTVSRDPCGRWYVAFAVDVPGPEALHKASASLVRDHDVIVLEDLAVKNMVRNRTLARAISDCGRGAFRAMTGYKAAGYGRRVIVIGRWYPSSKTCSACGYLLAGLGLEIRAWPCPSCGTRHDRDHNAAQNILAAGRAVAGGQPPGHACGADISHSGSSRVRSAVKQEPRPVRAGIPVLQGRG